MLFCRAKPLFFHALASRPFALLVAPFFTSAVAPGAKLSRPRHHALGGTSLAHRRCIPSSSRICRMFRNGPLPVCFIMSADEAVPSQGPQGRRPRADARPRSLRFGHVHQPGWRMCMRCLWKVKGLRRCRSPHRGAELAPQPRRPRSAREGLRGHRAAHVPVLRRGRDGHRRSALAGNVPTSQLLPLCLMMRTVCV